MTTPSFSARLKYLLSTTLLAGVLSLVAGTAAAGDKMKIGFIYISPVGDAGWTFQHDLARKALEETYGDQIEVTVIDNVPGGAEAERVTRELAASGNQLIFGTSFGYMNPMLKVAKRKWQKTFRRHILNMPPVIKCPRISVITMPAFMKVVIWPGLLPVP